MKKNDGFLMIASLFLLKSQSIIASEGNNEESKENYYPTNKAPPPQHSLKSSLPAPPVIAGAEPKLHPAPPMYHGPYKVEFHEPKKVAPEMLTPADFIGLQGLYTTDFYEGDHKREAHWTIAKLTIGKLVGRTFHPINKGENIIPFLEKLGQKLTDPDVKYEPDPTLFEILTPGRLERNDFRKAFAVYRLQTSTKRVEFHLLRSKVPFSQEEIDFIHDYYHGIDEVPNSHQVVAKVMNRIQSPGKDFMRQRSEVAKFPEINLKFLVESALEHKKISTQK